MTDQGKNNQLPPSYLDEKLKENANPFADTFRVVPPLQGRDPFVDLTEVDSTPDTDKDSFYPNSKITEKSTISYNGYTDDDMISEKEKDELFPSPGKKNYSPVISDDNMTADANNEINDTSIPLKNETETKQVDSSKNDSNGVTESAPEPALEPSTQQSAPALPERKYNFDLSSVFKTSERIMDDVRNDPYFLFNRDFIMSDSDALDGLDYGADEYSDDEEKEDIISQPTSMYADRLIDYLKTSPYNRYEIVHLSSYPPQLMFDSKVDLNTHDHKRLWSFKCLLVPKNAAKDQFSLRPLVHLNIKIKGKMNIERVQHQFYLFEDSQLMPDDYKDLVIDTSNLNSEGEKFTPKIIQATNYICKITQTIMRIELIESVFDCKDFKKFQTEEIQMRYISFLSSLESESLADEYREKNGVPSTVDCLYTLFKVLRGPLAENSDGKTLKTGQSAELNINLDKLILSDKLNFTNLDNEEYSPPLFDENTKEIGREFYRRALLEVSYYGSVIFTDRSSSSWVPSSRAEDTFKNKITFTNKFDKFWSCLNEPNLPSQIELWNHWYDSRYYNDSSLILLSCLPYYSENAILNNYNILTNLEEDNIPEFFDALKYIATNYSNLQNIQMYVTKLISQGVIGYQELKFLYATFNVDITKIGAMSDLSDEKLLSIYKDFLAISEGDLKHKKVLRAALSKLATQRDSPFLTQYLDTELFFDMDEAYGTLEIDPSVDDDTCILAYQLKVSDSRYYNPLFGRALMTIANFRKSFMLLNYIDDNLRVFFQSFNNYISNCDRASDSVQKWASLLDFCYKEIGCDKYADDYQIVRIVQERIQKDPNCNFRDLWKSLKTVATARNSKLIEGFIGSGMIDSRLLATDRTPAGLNNIGNTCYLNSLLQFYFVIEPLRSLTLNFDKVFDESEEKFNQTEFYQNRRIGGRTVSYKETERSYQFMYQLRNLFSDMIHLDSTCVSPTRELAYLAFAPSTDPVEFVSEDIEETNNNTNSKVVEVTGEDDDENLAFDSAGAIAPDSRDPNMSMDTEEDHTGDVADSEFQPISGREIISDEEMSTPEEEEEDIEEEREEFEKMDMSPAPQGDLIDLSTPEVPEHTKENQNVYQGDGANGSTLQSEDKENIVNLKPKNAAKVAKISFDQIENALELGRQQDVVECIENVLFQMESALSEDTELDEENEQYDLIKKLFYGKTSQKLTPIDSKTKKELTDRESRSKVERFLHLIVNIGDHPKDIYDALDTYFTEDLVNLDDGDYKRSLTITELPIFLQIQIQRVQFDRVRLMPVKSIEPLPFKETLCIDRYMETDDEELIRRRNQVFLWKQQISELNRRKELLNERNKNGLTLRESLVASKEFLTSEIVNEIGILVDTNTLNVIQQQIDLIDEESKTIDEEVNGLLSKIANQYNDVQFNNIRYSIFAIFIHRGQASYGHYWIYIRDPESNIYRKYNDEIVSEVSLEEVMNFAEENTATPYYLVFVKEDHLKSVQPLKRDIVATE